MNNTIDDKAVLQELVTITAEKLGLQKPYVIEKDFYLTQVIGILSEVADENFKLIFQGGTCLAKAHGVVARMSEDCDFRMAYQLPNMHFSKEKQRKLLRQFRKQIVAQLQASGFTIEAETIRVRNEGQFMAIPIQYPALFPGDEALKPYLALEFFLNDVKTATVEKPVTSLIQTTLGKQVGHPTYKVNAMSVVETAAEKWVALTRRIATIAHREHYRDTNLVRHLYDLYQIEARGLFTEQFPLLVADIIEEDKQHYKNHNSDYQQNPVSEIKRAINELQTNTEWQTHWQQFVDTMVFAETKPSYEQVLQNLLAKSELALAVLETKN